MCLIYIYVHTDAFITKKRDNIHDIVLISITTHVVVAGIYNYLLLSIRYTFFFQQASVSYISLSNMVTQIFIPEELRSEPWAVLSDLGCCFPLDFFTGYGNTEKHSNGFPVFKIFSSTVK